MNKTGFGFLRLPQKAENVVDYDVLNPMVDRFFELGGKYFDTAFNYLNGKSEIAIRKAVVQRYPRESFILADKLPTFLIRSAEECKTYFTIQLMRCGVEYFDVYLLHWLNEENYSLAEKYDGFGFISRIKAEGKAKKIGFSYHDSPELLERILTAHPEIDIVQLQINYLDWESPSIRARECYEAAVRHGKEVIVMEPVKGGSIATVPKEAEALMRSVRPNDSAASWAIRFASDLEQVSVVLSGMNTMDQMKDNMRNMEPLTKDERKLLEKCAEIIRARTAIPCTGCGYCIAGCPKGIPIPKYFALYNELSVKADDDWKVLPIYKAMTKTGSKASDCIICRKCEKSCPQKLKITEYLKDVAAVMEDSGL